MASDPGAAAFREVNSLTFEEAEGELEAINALLSTGHVPLEEQLAAHERAALLDSHCRALLDSFKARLAQLEALRSGAQPSVPGRAVAEDEPPF